MFECDRIPIILAFPLVRVSSCTHFLHSHIPVGEEVWGVKGGRGLVVRPRNGPAGSIGCGQGVCKQAGRFVTATRVTGRLPGHTVTAVVLSLAWPFFVATEGDWALNWPHSHPLRFSPSPGLSLWPQRVTGHLTGHTGTRCGALPRLACLCGYRG